MYVIEKQNPHATAPLQIEVTSNVTLDEINANVKTNAQKDIRWFMSSEYALPTSALVVGGGPSLRTDMPKIRDLSHDATVIAVNGASQFLSKYGVQVDHQVIIDARAENASLIDVDAAGWHFASQCNPAMFELVSKARTEMVHLNSPDIEDNFSQAQRDAGGYTLIGGGGSVGNSALCLAHAMGYRNLHVFGFDSSIHGDKRHAYKQAMNDAEQLIVMRFKDRAYWLSYTMAVQYNLFFQIEAELKKLGTKLHVHGEGILPDTWRHRQDVAGMSEAEKYTYVWQHEEYGAVSPGERIADTIDAWLPADSGAVVDLGCGTGKASVALAKKGRNVILLDFVENSRVKEALSFPFFQADLSQPLPVTAQYGFCCDVMEHIPPEQVDDVLLCISSAIHHVLFRIEFDLDGHGPVLIGSPLHLSVHDSDWWTRKLGEYFSDVTYEGNGIFKCRSE